MTGGWMVVSPGEKRWEVWNLLTVLLRPLPIQFYEVKCRLQPLVNKRKETFPGREGPEAVTPSSMSSFTKHCSLPKRRPSSLSPLRKSAPGSFYFRPGATRQHYPGADSQILWVLLRTPANILEKEPSQFSICIPHQRSHLARRHPAACKIQSTKLFL